LHLSAPFLSQLAHEPAVLVTVSQVQGSVPREVDTWMAVFAGHELGTIGGGHLEFQAMAQARALLNQGEPQRVLQKVVLGPSLGQCCGGVVHLKFEPVSQADIALLRQRLQVALTPVALFGGGHVGRALVRVLGDLPFQVHWIDSRDGVFPADLPAHVHCEHSEPVHGAVKDLPPGSRVLIMSFSHAEDLDVVAACLQRVRERADLPFIGLIGSATKWATFRRRLEARGFDEGVLAGVTSPIGLPGIHGKSPAEIAVAVAAQLLLLP
jgi:xanthine dehydrogenase accessory factor